MLLEGHGYQTTLLDSHPTGVVDELLEGAHLLLITPRVDEGVREAFVGAMGKRVPQKADMPVIALSTAVEEGLPEKEEVISVCRGLLRQRTSWNGSRPPVSMCLRHLLLLRLNKTGRVESLGAVMRPLVAMEKLMRLITGKGWSREVRLPPGYSLDRSDPDVLVLRSPDGTALARFSARGATTKAIEQEAWRHYRAQNWPA